MDELVALLDEYAALIEARERWRSGAPGDPNLSDVRHAVRFQVAERELRSAILRQFDQRVDLRDVRMVPPKPMPPPLRDVREGQLPARAQADGAP